jgi:hypothetical protein
VGISLSLIYTCHTTSQPRTKAQLVYFVCFKIEARTFCSNFKYHDGVYCTKSFCSPTNTKVDFLAPTISGGCASIQREAKMRSQSATAGVDCVSLQRDRGHFKFKSLLRAGRLKT